MRRAVPFVAAALLAGVAGVGRAADTFFLDWIVGPGGIVVADADDRFFVRRDFLNASEQQAAWRTEAAELVFEIGPDHVLQTPGADDGPSQSGYLDNFAWGTLRLKSGQHLELQDANATPGAAQYVRRLLLEGGVAQIKDVSSDGTWLYYDPGEPANDYLAGGTYPLAGGGAIAPVAPAPACDNGLDDDGDGLTDFPADPDCASPLDETEYADSDGDGVADSLDNCTYEPNPTQSDVGGLGAAPPDGIGDACQCGDTNNSGTVTATDATVLSRAIAGLSPYFSVASGLGGGGPGLAKCNVGAVNPGVAGCTASDATVIGRAVALLSPGILQNCDAALP